MVDDEDFFQWESLAFREIGLVEELVGVLDKRAPVGVVGRMGVEVGGVEENFLEGGDGAVAQLEIGRGLNLWIGARVLFWGRGGGGSGLLLFEGDGPVFVGEENICQRARLGFGEVGSIEGVACVEDEVLPFGELGRVDAEFFGSCLKLGEGGHDAVAAIEGRRGGSSRLGDSPLGGSGFVLRCEVEIDPLGGRGVELEFVVERLELRELEFHFLECLVDVRILGEAPVCGRGRSPGARKGSG